MNSHSHYHTFLPLNLILFSLFCFCFSLTSCATSFSYPSFSANDVTISVNGSAVKQISSAGKHPSIKLTSTGAGSQVYNTSGRAYYSFPIQLWNPQTNVTADFNTSFEFTIQFNDNSSTGPSGGIAFFVASEGSKDIPLNADGGWLGLFNQSNDGNSSNQIVAVEFDTYKDSWDPSDNHVGINVNSIVSRSNMTWNNTMVSDDIYRAQISYNASSKELSVFLKDPQVQVDNGTLRLNYTVDLREALPPKVIVGFSGSSEARIAIQLIRSWNFTSTLDTINEEENSTSKIWIVGLALGLVILVLLGILLFFIYSRKMKKKIQEEEDDDESYIIDSVDEDFEMGAGPKRFAYKDLLAATNNFSEEGKLGQGGFGDVYKGFLPELNMEIAVKKISSSSKQGKKEYISEVKTISRLRHRNLVQLIGWSHERGNFLLVYEFMPNGSLDTHLFPKKGSSSTYPGLSWNLRYKIAQNLASGLLYLHEEWEKCVVHRDIKSSNVMLDSNFTAKLGDFGLARLVDHDHQGSQMTTVVAGTMGYMAPEYLITGQASKESDVFSFGVVALELACGRKAVEPTAGESKISLVSWLWELNSRGRILEAAEENLGQDFDNDEMIRLMSVGLWCAHPDHDARPSIRKAIQVLNFESPLPSLPSYVPVPKFYPSPGVVSVSASYTWSEQIDQSQTNVTHSSTVSDIQITNNNLSSKL